MLRAIDRYGLLDYTAPESSTGALVKCFWTGEVILKSYSLRYFQNVPCLTLQLGRLLRHADRGYCGKAHRQILGNHAMLIDAGMPLA